jgi:hypothetical protein
MSAALPNPIEVTPMKLPAAVAGGSVATATGLLAWHLPPLAAGMTGWPNSPPFFGTPGQ